MYLIHHMYGFCTLISKITFWSLFYFGHLKKSLWKLSAPTLLFNSQGRKSYYGCAVPPWFITYYRVQGLCDCQTLQRPAPKKLYPYAKPKNPILQEIKNGAETPSFYLYLTSRYFSTLTFNLSTSFCNSFDANFSIFCFLPFISNTIISFISVFLSIATSRTNGSLCAYKLAS